MTAGSVIDRMSNEEFMAYIAGITEGLAYARYEEGGVEAMSCVFDWFYRTPNTIRQVDQAFRQFPDHYPGAVMGALLRRQCGE